MITVFDEIRAAMHEINIWPCMRLIFVMLGNFTYICYIKIALLE